MLAPISWLKEYVDIKLPLKELMWKMTEAGLTCESYKKVDGEVVLDVEVTANRPDWMSIVGIAREIAAIQKTTIRLPKIPDLPKPTSNLPMEFKNDFNVMERWSAVTISGITIKPSPDWMQKRLKLVGLRPINNIVDITNYVMFELGNPMHAFDYDEIKGRKMISEITKGGEVFTSVDELTYKLPKDAMIIRDTERIIDLCGIKGGFNSGIKANTKNILIHSTIDNPVLTRRSSIALGLRSDASAIYERGPDKGGTVQTLKRMAHLIMELAGGQIASKLTDLKKKDFLPWNIKLNLNTLEKVLGVKISNKNVISILTSLNLSPKLNGKNIRCTIPTYRADIKVQEDLIEEVARIYGYNKFPKTLPSGKVNPGKIPYFFDDAFNLRVKETLTTFGFDETMTLSLISKELIDKSKLNVDKHLHVANPVSSDYEYLRNTLIPNLLAAVKMNPGSDRLLLYELGKVYLGKPGNTTEPYRVAAVAKGYNFREFKGFIDALLIKLNVDGFSINTETYLNLWHPVKSATLIDHHEEIGSFGLMSPEICRNFEIDSEVYAFEIDINSLQKLSKASVFTSVPDFPPQIEDLTLTFPEKTKIGEVVDLIKTADPLIRNAQLDDIYEKAYTFRIWYQNPKKTLNNEEVTEIRNKILQSIKTKFGGTLKE